MKDVLEIIKPKVVKLNHKQARILFGLSLEGFKYISQDVDGDVHASIIEPYFDSDDMCWFMLEDYITSGDEVVMEEVREKFELFNGCYKIEDLLKDYFKEEA
ncbi:MAG: hypothetical protein ACRCTZ_18345 [Sarcina sp.]